MSHLITNIGTKESKGREDQGPQPLMESVRVQI